MIKAELFYNPYLMEIKVKFNDQPPRINSLVEKYSETLLQDWINELPQIFHDEMNGYDFELDFYGTELDFEELENAFRAKGVSDKDVHLVLKTDVECREVKVERIRDLLEWLDKNRYAKFDYDSFRAENYELFDTDFEGVVLHGTAEKSDLKNVSLENVDDVLELENTDLTHTPILYCISEENDPLVRHDMQYLRTRNDVSDGQLFFCITGTNPKVIRRLLVDLGIKEPNIVSGINDEAVKKYFLLYTFSDYIFTAVKLFEKYRKQFIDIMSIDHQQARAKNSLAHANIQALDKDVRNIKDASSFISSTGDIEYPTEFDSVYYELEQKLQGWEGKKVKITDVSAAQVAAANYDDFAQRCFQSFVSDTAIAAQNEAQNIVKFYKSKYDTAGVDHSFSVFIPFIDDSPGFGLNGQINALLNIKSQQYVTPKSSYFTLFNSYPTTEPTKVLETTYYYQYWRNHMVKTVTPVANNISQYYYGLLKKYDEQIKAVYLKHLDELLEKTYKAKETSSENLSVEEKALQKDNDWLDGFTEKLKLIERS